MSQGNLVVVGASLAGLRAVEAARRFGFTGRITLVGAEDHLPYDRPPLSKAFLTSVTEPSVALTDEDRLVRDLDVELCLGQPATALDPAGQRVRVGARWLGYTGLIVATGSRANALPGLPDLAGIHRLRTIADARAVRAALHAGARVLVVGAGFIGAEVASSARSLGLPVTIVETQATPLVRAVGAEMGAALAGIHRDHGVDLRCGTTIEAVFGADRVSRVLLSDGHAVDCDLLVVGVGARPATDWLADSGLTLANGLVCGPDLAAGPPGVYGAGDVVRWPNGLGDDFVDTAPIRLEHWTNAAEQAAAAVRNWLSPAQARPFTSVPYFWSDWYEHRVQFVGSATADEVRVAHGDIAERKFVALYRRADRLVGALAVNRPALVMKFRALIAKSADWADALEFAATR